MEYRLGDVIDDFCVKCRRITNHSIVSLVDGAAAKVRCRTCYSDHDYRHEIAPPSKRELKKAQLFNEVLAGVAPAAAAADGAETKPLVDGAPAPDSDLPSPPAAEEKKPRGRARKSAN